jgi:hypothetical protein
MKFIFRIHQTAQLAVTVSKKPKADCRSDAGQDQELVAHDQRRQNNQREATGTNRRARGTLPMSSLSGG